MFRVVQTPVFIGCIILAFMVGILVNPIITEKDKELEFYRTTDMLEAYTIISLQDSLINLQKIVIDDIADEAYMNGAALNSLNTENTFNVKRMEATLKKLCH